jgi:hypothetical protein
VPRKPATASAREVLKRVRFMEYPSGKISGSPGI